MSVRACEGLPAACERRTGKSDPTVSNIQPHPSKKDGSSKSTRMKGIDKNNFAKNETKVKQNESMARTRPLNRRRRYGPACAGGIPGPGGPPRRRTVAYDPQPGCCRDSECGIANRRQPKLHLRAGLEKSSPRRYLCGEQQNDKEVTDRGWGSERTTQEHRCGCRNLGQSHTAFLNWVSCRHIISVGIGCPEKSKHSGQQKPRIKEIKHETNRRKHMHAQALIHHTQTKLTRLETRGRSR